MIETVYDYEAYGYCDYKDDLHRIAFMPEPYPAPQNEPIRTLLISESIEKQKRYFTNRRK